MEGKKTESAFSVRSRTVKFVARYHSFLVAVARLFAVDEIIIKEREFPAILISQERVAGVEMSVFIIMWLYTL